MKATSRALRFRILLEVFCGPFNQIIRESPKQPGVSLWADRPDSAEDFRARQDGQKSETDYRIGQQPRCPKILFSTRNDPVKVGDGLMKLGTDAAHKEVSERWEFAQQ